MPMNCLSLSGGTRLVPCVSLHYEWILLWYTPLQGNVGNYWPSPSLSPSALGFTLWINLALKFSMQMMLTSTSMTSSCLIQIFTKVCLDTLDHLQQIYAHILYKKIMETQRHMLTQWISKHENTILENRKAIGYVIISCLLIWKLRLGGGIQLELNNEYIYVSLEYLLHLHCFGWPSMQKDTCA